MASMNKQWQEVQPSECVQEYFMLGEFIQSDNWDGFSPPNFTPNNYPYLKDCIEYNSIINGNIKHGLDIENEIRVTEITHGTSCENMLSIINNGGFAPNKKNIPGIGDMDLVWFEIKVGETEIDCVREKYKQSANNLLQYGLPMSTVDRCTSRFACAAPFQPMSRYGNFKFTFSIREVLLEYDFQFGFSQGRLNIRKLGTFAYKMETMHVILIYPPNTSNYDQCPLLFADPIIQPDETFETWIWRPHSTGDKRLVLTSSGNEFPCGKRWEHVAFAFLVPEGNCLKIANMKDHLSLCLWQHMNRAVSGVNADINNMLELLAFEETSTKESLAELLIHMIRGYLDERPIYMKRINPEFPLHQVDLSIDLGWVSGKIKDLLQIDIKFLDWSPLIDWMHSVTGLQNLPDLFSNLQSQY